MYETLNEVNRLLFVVHRLSRDESGIRLATVINACRGVVYEARFPNHYETVAFCIDAGLIRRVGDQIEITNLGLRLIALNPELYYRLNEAQKELIVTECFITGKFSSDIINILARFTFTGSEYAWSNVEPTEEERITDLIRLMLEAGLLKYKDTNLFINDKYVSTVYKILNPSRLLTSLELAERIKNEKAIGDVAEQIALISERARLKGQGLVLESECIERVSEIDVAAGFDIKSFNSNSPKLIYDRFIEVKGSTNTDLDFYWSRNEIEQARKLRSKYWVYFVCGIDLQTKTSNDIIRICDPVLDILGNKEFEVVAELFSIKKKR